MIFKSRFHAAQENYNPCYVDPCEAGRCVAANNRVENKCVCDVGHTGEQERVEAEEERLNKVSQTDKR